MSRHIFFMKKALALAERGRGRVHPNPMVGSLLVRNGKIISQGNHEIYGGPHAEVHALKGVKKVSADDVLYVTLEPCDHYGKTPPCTKLILEKGVKTVVIGARDPNPLVCGKGIKKLRAAGVNVITGPLAKESETLNRDYTYFMKSKLPYVIVKAAQSLDGKIATKTGDSKWITSEQSRRLGHELRAGVDAVLVGANTVIQDNPRLTARLGKKTRQPLKVILDSHLRTPKNARVFSGAGANVVLAVTRRAPKNRFKQFKNKAEIFVVQEKNGRVDLKALLKILASRGIMRVLIEGGGELIADAFEKKLVKELYMFIAPVVIGGRAATTSVEGKGIQSIKQALKISRLDVRRIGNDILLHGVL